MSELPKCPQCGSENTYDDGRNLVCPDCGHEWQPGEAVNETADMADEEFIVRDAYGTILQEGDAVTVIKDLKVKGSSTVLKRGTVIKNIRLTDDEDEVEGRTDKVKGLVLRTEFLKKS